MSAIGILGGMGPQASAKLVEMIVNKTRDFVDQPIDSDFPEIVLLSVPVPNFVSNTENMQKAEKMLLKRLKIFETAGCVVNGIACNTAHLLLPKLSVSTEIPFVSIPELVAEKIKHEGFRRIGLLATPNTLSSTLYDEALDDVAVLVRPTKRTATECERLIFKKLQGQATSNDAREFHKMVKRFLGETGLDAVILGCTELPLLFEGNDKRVISTLDVLADGLLASYFKT